MPRAEKTVFISYRRKDISWALAVYQNLTAYGFDVFFDYKSIHSGDFDQIIIGNIKARAHFLIILTPTALDRCSEPGDWLRREIETAISERRNIIPLFFEGFDFGIPSISEKMSGKLRAINKYNGLEVPTGYFDEAMERLRTRYLDITLDAVLHPVSDEVQQVVKEQQVAANEAISNRKELEDRERKEVEEEARKEQENLENMAAEEQTEGAIEKPQVERVVGKPIERVTTMGATAEKRIALKPNLLYYGIGAIVILVLMCGVSIISYNIQNWFPRTESSETGLPPIQTSTSTFTPIHPTFTSTSTFTPGPPTFTSTSTFTLTPVNPTLTSGPTTITLNATGGTEGGTVYEPAAGLAVVNGTILAGDIGSNYLARGYMSFDISSLSGKTVTAATLDLSACAQMRDPFSNLAGIWVGEVQYALPLDQSDYDILGTGIQLLNALPSSPIDVKSYVQTRVTEGRNRFQIRLHSKLVSSNEDSQADYIACGETIPKLTIDYLP